MAYIKPFQSLEILIMLPIKGGLEGGLVQVLDAQVVRSCHPDILVVVFGLGAKFQTQKQVGALTTFNKVNFQHIMRYQVFLFAKGYTKGALDRHCPNQGHERVSEDGTSTGGNRWGCESRAVSGTNHRCHFGR
jgi:hypothetical protein